MPSDSFNIPETELAAALRERRALIADEASRRDPGNHLARLKNVSEKIVRLAQTLPRPIDRRLAHYLEHCSYDKALEALEAKL